MLTEEKRLRMMEPVLKAMEWKKRVPLHEMRAMQRVAVGELGKAGRVNAEVERVDEKRQRVAGGELFDRAAVEDRAAVRSEPGGLNNLLDKKEELALLSAYQDWGGEKRHHCIAAGLRSVSEQQKVFGSLAAQGLIIEWSGVVTGRRGGGVTLIEVTKRGIEYLENRFPELKPVRVRGTGGRRHQWYQDRIMTVFADAGFKAEAEGLIKSKGVLEKKRCDVLVTCADLQRFVCLEVALNSKHEIFNALAVLEESSELVEKWVVACENKKVLDEVKKEFGENQKIKAFDEKIIICLVSEVLNGKLLKQLKLK